MALTHGEQKVLEACDKWLEAMDKFDKKLDYINDKLDKFNTQANVDLSWLLKYRR